MTMEALKALRDVVGASIGSNIILIYIYIYPRYLIPYLYDSGTTMLATFEALTVHWLYAAPASGSASLSGFVGCVGPKY